jgi:hypothetical protein
MAAIVPVALTDLFTVVRTGTAQANVGQTDWVAIPAFATDAVISLDITAVAGTTPGPTTLSLKTASPKTLNDTNTSVLSAGSAIASTGYQEIVIGPGVTGIADAGAATRVTVNTVLPDLLGLSLLLSRADGDETYTYTLAILLK